ncbi:anthrone oxygenase family protein [Actinokineospora sp. NBRC 105648]|uniref:anthrone oxygenase family protein n=1 Tax=Actinokineospora sp. NBRC 105648 TaxID=3032206 RepID=UPI0025531428|nr:anthrone oxygenase family protein [Actinokineospora sp. NBRC 105648]
MDTLDVLSTVAAVGSGMVAGIFFAFSVFMMRAFAALPPAQGIAAMQTVNRVIVTPLFLVLFLGTAVVGVIAAIVGAVPQVVGAALYVLGAIVVTGTRNVPWNNELDALTPDTAAAAEYWLGYLRRWTAWNHVRTVTSTGAAVAFVVS